MRPSAAPSAGMHFHRPVDDVNPDFAAFVARWDAVSDRPLHTLGADELRLRLNRLGSDDIPPRPTSVVVENRTIALADRNLDIRIYRHAEGEAVAPALIYYRGGGWIIGTLDSHDPYLSVFCDRSRATIISVDYRRAPEHPHPAQNEDAWDSFVWIAQHAAELRIDPTRLGMGGDSAGAQLTAAMALRARAASGPTIAMQLLIYPFFDAAFERFSHWRFRDGPVLTRDWLMWEWATWQGRATTADAGPDACPLREADLSGLPPAELFVAGSDPLLDEGVEFAHRLLDAGVPARLAICRGLPHGFMRGMFESPSAAQAVEEIAQSIRRGLVI